MRVLGKSLVLVIPLGLIGVGTWMIFPPLALVAVGGLIWHDLRSGAEDAS